jgi:hypothetical protein
MNDAEPDIHRLWHDQPREKQPTSVDEIRSKAERFARRTHRWNVTTAVLFGALILLEGWQVWRESRLLERVGDSLTIAALIAVVYQFRARWTARSIPAGLALTSSVDFYRDELARQRDLARSPWRYLVLFIPGVALSLLGDVLERSVPQTIAIAGFGVALFLGVAWLNTRTARRLQRDIDELA